MARPPKKLNYAKIEKLAEAQLTDYELAARLDYTEEGFRKRRLADDTLVGAIKKGRAKGCGSVRRVQYEKALAGDTTSMIWFGKNYLGQSDKQDVTTNQPITVTIIKADRSKGE